MSDGDSSSEPEANINAIYVAQFRQHLAQVRAHLAGTDAVPLLPSYLPPTGYWTAEEKDEFFHALSVHSRFRPDLISACVKTKTILDVCAYIDALSNTLSRGHSLPPLRSNLECAMEVSDSWVQWEEANAEDLVVIEPKWEEEALEQRHEGEMIMRANSVEAITAADNGNLASADRETWERVRRRIWRRETALKRLDLHHLGALDGFLRQTESEVANTDADQVQSEDQECQVNILSSSSPQPVTLSHSSPGERSPNPQGFKEKGADPSDLTPMSRRRFQKKLYMRRKRAQQRGEEVVSDFINLRPGRKVEERKPPKQRPKYYKTKTKTSSREENEVDNIPMDVEAPSPHGIPRYKTGGLTKPYKIKRDFMDNGIDGKTLQEGNLGLFHLSTLGRFMKLYKSGYDEPTTTTTTTISADTIRLLTVVIEEFTSEIVHRIIIFREQDRIMKGDIKVYGRSHDEITPEKVEYVLDMIGMRGLTKEKYFAQLLGESVFGTSEVQSDSEGGEGHHGSHGVHRSTALPALPPLHREVHPLFIYLPESLLIPTEIITSTGEDLCIPVHADEEDLEEELEEERQLDEADSLLARQYEVDLWKQFGLEHKHKDRRKGTRRKRTRKGTGK
ncbi:hypothetical protein L208DRAFT_1359837 [Tricholoma matsutake]|nr:hypothetical protein L208DRAFT_1359837 [Tricholoma matsutake 945]